MIGIFTNAGGSCGVSGFKEKYQEICAKVRAGLSLPAPRVPSTTSIEAVPTAKAEAVEKLAALRAKLDI